MLHETVRKVRPFFSAIESLWKVHPGGTIEAYVQLEQLLTTLPELL